MAKETGISWCDSTFNPWIGCTRIGPGCDHCYAEQQDSRKRWDGGKTHWGVGVSRYRTKQGNWKQPLTWNRHAINGLLPDGKTASDGRSPRVFCASLADVFDNEVPPEWLADLFFLIRDTPHLEWLLVTKRISNAARTVKWLEQLPNVRLMITVCNQEEADRDIPKLLALPCKNGISYEPALGLVDFSIKECRHEDGYVEPDTNALVCRKCEEENDFGGIDWIIVGGESGPRARPFSIEWARATVKQCKAAEVPCFVKQLGSAISVANDSMEEWPDEDAFSDAIPEDYQPACQGWHCIIRLKNRAGADPTEWPEDLRIQEFPE